MRLITLLLLLLALVPARAYAQDRGRHVPGLWPSAEQVLNPTPSRFRLGLGPLPEAALRSSGLALGEYTGAAPAFAGPRSGPRFLPPPEFLRELERDRRLLVTAEPAVLAAVPADTTAGAADPVEPADTVERAPAGPLGVPYREVELPAVVEQVADLAVAVEGRGELGGVWNRYRPCEPGLRLHCNPDLLPRLQPEIQFGVRVDGTITDRIHVDVDYDQRREFDAANNINVYYEGLPGELLQRVEMGDVSVGLPPSRYLTQGVPAGNFGFKAAARVGATDVEAVWAQQKGDIAAREFRLGGLGDQAGLVQDQELVLDDTDYVLGQFFFLVDPSRIAGWPHLDVLTLNYIDAPADVRPLSDRLVLYRDEGAAAARYTDQGRTGKFLADAVSDDGTLRHSGLFTLLEPGQDYYIHSSGLWIALRAPLREDEALAVAYLTETGDTVGDPAAESAPPGTKPVLRLVRGPATIHQPGQPTWPWEMHQIYRLDSSAEVETSTLDLVISLGHEAGGATFQDHGGGQLPLLRLFGLDDDAPADRVDEAHVFRPGSDMEGFGEPSALRGTFIVFPTLEPFGRPPPVPREGLSAVETAAILGPDANPVIYDEPDPVIRRSSARFRLNFDYRVRLEGLLSSFNLGAFGIRQGSERITVDDVLLVRGVDYVIDYDLGLVTLLEPGSVLGSNPDALIRITWEQKAIFEIAPTTVVGLTSQTQLGAYGQLNLLGMYQAEQSIVRRPQLGLAPGAVLLGGASGRLAFQADWLARALDAVPFLFTDSTARMDVTGELALSTPEPNRKGATYLDDFEATDEIPLSLDAFEWKQGSAPQDPTGAPNLPWPMTVDNAARLVWQDRYLQDGREVGFLNAQQIDQQIAFAGAPLAERVLYMTMGEPGRTVPPPQWRSITTVLSTTGRDLSRSEYLEFYAKPHAGPVNDAILVIDIGTVSEDAFYVDEEGRLSGTTEFGVPWGEGVLDEEARLALRDVWGPQDDAQGLWDQTCEADRLNPVPLGDPRANCTVLNGRPDTEDLNGNGVLDAFDGPSFRYVVPINSTSPYLVRDRSATGTDFRLFRIPLRASGAIPLNGASDATWRFVKHLRVTMVNPRSGNGTLALARVRIGGSRWTKREIHGVVEGLTGDMPGAGSLSTELRVGPVSRVTDGAVYASPPGVEDQLQDPDQALGASGVEFNEKSLRLSWDGLLPDERAEVYYRYPQQPRSFLEYRQLRFWAVARSGSWGGTGDHRLLVKLGTDARNYYLFQTPLNPVASAGRVAREDWLPERLIDFERWFELKAEAERQLIQRGAGGGPLVVWDADSTYAVVLEDRARAPNLAAVRELSFSVYNASGDATTGEVWIDDLRLNAGAQDPGFAGRVEVDLAAGGFLTAGLSFGGRGGRFRQLDDHATYETSDELAVNTTLELGRFAPAEWGVSMPLTVSYLRTSFDPIFLQGTDVRAERLPELRDTGLSRRRVSVSLRKTTPSSNPLVSALVDGTSVRLGYIRQSDATVTTAGRLDGLDGGINVDRSVANVDFGIVPEFLADVLRWIAPRAVERSPFFERLTGARLRLTPERVGLSASYTGQTARVWRYDGLLQRPDDGAVIPIESPRRTIEGGARVDLRPLESLTARFGVQSGRDVLAPDRATPLALERQALRRARTEVGGIPIGWERDRVVTATAAYRPTITQWLRPNISWTSRFGQRRDPAYLAVDTTAPAGQRADLARTFNADRRLSQGVVFDPGGMLRAAVGEADSGVQDSGVQDAGVQDAGVQDSGEADSGVQDSGVQDSGEADSGVQEPPRRPVVERIILETVGAIKPVELTWTDEVGSRFDRQRAAPGAGYQLGWGAFDGFRMVDGDTAATALDRHGFRARSGVQLGSVVSVDVAYGESDGRVFDLRAGERDEVERSWPDVQLTLQDVPVPDWLQVAVERWSFSTGYVHTERALTLEGVLPRVRQQEERTVPFDVRIGFAGGLALSYIASISRGDGRDPTGRLEQDGVGHSGDISGRFMAPFGLDDRVFPQPVRLSVSYDYQWQRQCRAAGNRGPSAPCTAFIDAINRRVNLSLSTLVSQIDVGLQGSYVDRRSSIGTQAGSSQLQLGLFGQFNIQAGRVGGE